jgi:hypothetical protein
MASGDGASFWRSSTNWRQGRPLSRPAAAAELGLGLLLQVQAVAPELRRAGHQGVLVVQTAAELLLADGEGLGVSGRLDLVAQRGAEPLEGLSACPAAACSSPWSPGASAPSVLESWTTSSPPPPSMPSALSTNTAGGSRRVARPSSRKRGRLLSRSSAAGARPPAASSCRARMA